MQARTNVQMKAIEMTNNEIIKEAQQMAVSTITIGMRWKWWEYNIKDNPYKFHKKNSLVWYNAFYDKCREIGRSI